MFSITVLSHPQQRPTPVNADFKSQLSFTHRLSQTGSSPAPLQSFKSQPKPAGRRQQSAPHQSTWRKAILRGTELPLLPPTLGAQVWPSTSPGSESRLLDNGHTPTISLSSPSAIAPIFLPPILGCCKGFAAVCQLYAGLKLFRGPRREMRGHALAPENTTSSGHPLTKPCHSSGRACGGRVPSGRKCAPALPGEVCKHSCSRAGEPLGTRQPGLHQAGAGGWGRQGAGVPRLKPRHQAETPLQPPSQAGRAPSNTPKSPLKSRETGSPTPCRKDTPALGAAHGKGEGANLDSVRRADCAQSPSRAL